MLFILTGDRQTGKTRWLQSLLADLSAAGVEVCGVVAPGQWVDRGEGTSARFEKLGIDNVLLPEGERIAFARRQDLAAGEACSQAQAAQLGWAIADTAIDQVNAHFCGLCGKAKDCALPDDLRQQLGIEAVAPQHPGLLVIDELGTEYPGQMVNTLLYTLINDRMMEHRPMIISTNLTMEQIQGRYSSQIASRLRGGFSRLLFLGEDIRVLKSRF